MALRSFIYMGRVLLALLCSIQLMKEFDGRVTVISYVQAGVLFVALLLGFLGKSWPCISSLLSCLLAAVAYARTASSSSNAECAWMMLGVAGFFEPLALLCADFDEEILKVKEEAVEEVKTTKGKVKARSAPAKSASFIDKARALECMLVLGQLTYDVSIIGHVDIFVQGLVLLVVIVVYLSKSWRCVNSLLCWFLAAVFYLRASAPMPATEYARAACGYIAVVETLAWCCDDYDAAVREVQEDKKTK